MFKLQKFVCALFDGGLLIVAMKLENSGGDKSKGQVERDKSKGQVKGTNQSGK